MFEIEKKAEVAEATSLNIRICVQNTVVSLENCAS